MIYDKNHFLSPKNNAYKTEIIEIKTTKIINATGIHNIVLNNQVIPMILNTNKLNPQSKTPNIKSISNSPFFTF